MTKQFLIRIIFLCCCVVSFSTSYAQKKYGGGNSAIVGIDCDAEIDNNQKIIKDKYQTSNDDPLGADCVWEIIKDYTQTRTACHGESDGILDVTLFRSGTYSFWWPSLGGTGDYTQRDSWYKVVVSGSTSTPALTLPPANMTGFGVQDGYIKVYDEGSNLLEVYTITVEEYAASFTPGAIVSAIDTSCFGGTPKEIKTSQLPTGGSGTYEYQWQIDNVDIPGATLTTYQPSSTLPENTYVFTRLDKDVQCNVQGTAATNQHTLVVYPPYAVQLTLAGTDKTNIDLCRGSELILDVNISLRNNPGKPSTPAWTGWYQPQGDANWTRVDSQSGSTWLLNTDAETILTTGTYVYKVEYDPIVPASCPSVISNDFIVNYIDTPTGGTLTVDATESCEDGPFPTLSLSMISNEFGGVNRVDHWEILQPGATSWTVINNTSETYQIQASDVTTAGVYKFRVQVVNDYVPETCKYSYSTEEEVVIGLSIKDIKVIDVLCDGGSSGQVTFDVIGGASPYKMSLNGGAYFDNKKSFLDLAVGNYTIVVHDSNGCITSATTTVKQLPKLTINVLDVSSVSAAGRRDASATLSASGGGGGYQYSTTGRSNDYSVHNVVRGLAEGLNYVFVRDQNGCVESANIQVTDKGINLIVDVIETLTCAEAADASVETTVFGGKPPYLYSKDGVNFVTSNILTGFGEGKQIITVKDNEGTTVSIAVTIDPANPIVFTAAVTKWPTVSRNAEVSLYATGGSGAYYYQVDNGTWTENNVFGGLTEGVHTFSVQDRKAAVCQPEPIIFCIPAPTTPPEANIILEANLIKTLRCEGDANAEIAVSAEGGSGSYTFALDGVTFNTPVGSQYVFTGLSKGSYTLKAQDTNGSYSCEIQIVVKEPERPAISVLSITPSSCGLPNGYVEITASGRQPLQYSVTGYQWYNNGSTTYTLTGLNAGDYNIFVKDAHGCINSTTATINAAAPVTFDITSFKGISEPGASDAEVSIEIYGGQAPYILNVAGKTLYTQTISANVYTFTGIVAGTYEVTVIDAGGCVAEAKYLSLNAEPELSIMYITEDPNCYGTSTGAIIVSAKGGTGTYSYSLDNVTYGPSNRLDNLSAGTYTLYVKDNADTPHKIGIPNIVLKDGRLTYKIEFIQTLSAVGAEDAVIQITAEGGKAPYQYNFNSRGWNGFGLVRSLGAGTYTIAVRDANSCITSGMFSINEDPTLPGVSARVVNNPTCYGGTDGAIAVTATGGQSPYMFSVDLLNWFTETITGLSAGTYTVYVKEVAYDRISKGPQVIITNPEKLKAEATITALPSAADASDGAITVVATGGKMPYQYLMQGDFVYQYGNQYNNLSSKLYTFNVKDANGCKATTSALLSEPGKISISAQIVNPLSCSGANDAVVSITASGGQPPYEYASDVNRSWTTESVLTGLSGGLHYLLVMDRNNVIDSLPIFIDQPMPLTAVARVIDLPTVGESNGSIKIVASGGSGNYHYMMGTVSYNVPIISNLSAGVYTLFVTDAVNSSCNATVHFVLSTVDLVVDKTVINLHKGSLSEVYTLRLTDEPAGPVTVEVKVENSTVAVTSPIEVVFTPANWNIEQEVVVTVAPGVGEYISELQSVAYYTTRIFNKIVSAPQDPLYMDIERGVIVNVQDDGDLACIDFEKVQPLITLNGEDIGNDAAAIELCLTADNSFVLNAAVDGAMSYRWLRDGFMEISTASSFTLSDNGIHTYTLETMNSKGCIYAGRTISVNLEKVPEAPVIVGPRVSMEGIEQTYSVQNANSYSRANQSYRWTIPQGYSLIPGSFDTDAEITMKIGFYSSVLLVSTRNNTGFCEGAEGSLDIEVMSIYAADVYPTLQTPRDRVSYINIRPKNMTVDDIGLLNMVGVAYTYKIESGQLPLDNDQEMQISVTGLIAGHYFVMLQGRTADGRQVSYSARIVVVN